ncbi:SOS response UmuD protein. Serine peptidase. MEROPS family S24 [Hymenobacter daecheongensis DSM 21074]|uniref:SOS response UmuD protein. Serine peptidase. MEROPS family S24 n=1 Tax=Hymenobacter daecheongensis DSM 21074 TaxID=1121955 RepID=A0A1M6FD73_9BACT|nr:S24 family peptidase [Hymenobacter daecheongensis]SHI95617.1 SOS response UmuD protein. Serine peptidase. MEROPS family S24 [Hymenobacter daecheongensis DSM 21074]
MAELVFFSPIKAAQLTRLPVFTCPVPAGFPLPGVGPADEILDLHQYLFGQPASTCLARVVGDTTPGVGIHPDDFIVVNRALTPSDGHIVVAVLNGAHSVHRLRQEPGRRWLEAVGEHYAPLELHAACDLRLWGVVTHVIHPLFRKRSGVA